MNLTQYELSRRLVARHPEPERWVGCRMERAGNTRASTRRPISAWDAKYDFSTGYAPDLSDPSCVGPLLALAAERVPSVTLARVGGQWRAEGESSGSRCGWGDTPGEALARMILEASGD